jgi:nucleotide-binding universal stress UspA family protein
MSRNQVLVLLDGSSFSERILPVVRRFLRPEENELTLFLVGKPPAGDASALTDLAKDDGPPGQGAIKRSQVENAQGKHPLYTSQVEDIVAVRLEEKLLPAANELRAAGYVVATEIGFGAPAQEIEEYIRYGEFDLVAMTTHGRTGLRRALLGSVAEHVLRHSNLPILLLHPFEKGFGV